ncbi:hypothetical protein EIP91_001944 [Steccherinum ochraceum]|uniref:F-box domain-containing protein n=1 Tax=Steccherinum ochraceum TaxID=92696 RepID=A0A4V2MWG8_9APHY|nr:hypothetical protein EIP91_001944 [Steccherinum ochraceum]
MHKIFQVQELVDLVVHNLAVMEVTETYPLTKHPSKAQYRMQSLPPEVKEDVKNLGQVGRIFREPCLDALWYHQDGIRELLRMTYGGKLPHREERQPLGPDDVPIFLFYASRIHELYFSRKFSIMELQLRPSDPSILGASRLDPGTVLFPRLRSLAWMFEGDFLSGDLSLVLDYAGDHLVEIASPAVSRNGPAELFSAMEKRRRSLTHLWLQPEDGQIEADRKATTRFFRTVLPQARNLQELHLDYHFEQFINVWNVLPSFPHLKKISLLSSDSTNLWETLSSSSNVTYGSLRSVTFQVSHASHLCKILRMIRFPNIRELHLMFPAPFAVTRFRSLSLAVTEACASSPLQSFVIDCGSLMFRGEEVVEDPEEARDVLKIDDLRPLLKYKTLEVLQLNVKRPWMLGDRAIQEIVRALGPRLRILELDPEGGWSSKECLTLSGLEYLATHCPRLSKLGLHFVGTPPADVRSVCRHIARSDVRWASALRELSVGCSPLDPASLNDLVLFLSSLFPNLSQITTASRLKPEENEDYEMQWSAKPIPGGVDIELDDEYVEEYVDNFRLYAGWKMVESMVPLLGLARRQERVLMTI